MSDFSRNISCQLFNHILITKHFPTAQLRQNKKFSKKSKEKEELTFDTVSYLQFHFHLKAPYLGLIYVP
jgi:hypothetical protein